MTGDEAHLAGQLDVRGQGLRDLPVAITRPAPGQVLLTMTLPGGQSVSFEGAWASPRLAGTYHQGGATSAFWLERGAAAVKPAEAAAGDGFREVPASFENGPVHLAGTLTLPDPAVSLPAVAVLVTGSGPQDRNEEIFGFKLFEELAHTLARAGIATLRYDDRGVGASTGDFFAATTWDFSTDAEAAIAFLRTRPEVDRARIGIIGHSEGGLVGPMVAARDPKVAFVVLLAGPGQSSDALLIAQTRLVAEREGKPQADIDREVAASRKVMALLKAGKDLSSMEAELGALCPEPCKARGEFIKRERWQSESPWFRFFATYDPAPTLAKVRCPVLALGGSLDVQVPSDLNLPLIKKALAQAHNPRVSIQEIAGMNHVLQAAKTGAVSEYAKLPKRLEPSVAPRIIGWVAALEPTP
ncbi:MAG: alpha/beta fold hydrolase [Archangiaceae bacterium]|nr:alpha/beta fold hydrolase [Archangiaceae bacterium]